MCFILYSQRGINKYDNTNIRHHIYYCGVLVTHFVRGLRSCKLSVNDDVEDLTG